MTDETRARIGAIRGGLDEHRLPRADDVRFLLDLVEVQDIDRSNFERQRDDARRQLTKPRVLEQLQLMATWYIPGSPSHTALIEAEARIREG